MIRVTPTESVAVGRFCIGGVDVRVGQWASVDPANPAARATLRAFVGTHLKVYPEDVPALKSAGLELVNGRLREAATAQAAPTPTMASPAAELAPEIEYAAAAGAARRKR